MLPKKLINKVSQSLTSRPGRRLWANGALLATLSTAKQPHSLLTLYTHSNILSHYPAICHLLSLHLTIFQHINKSLPDFHFKQGTLRNIGAPIHLIQNQSQEHISPRLPLQTRYSQKHWCPHPSHPESIPYKQ